MIISHKHKFVYIGPPKTASTAIHVFFEKEEWSGDTQWRSGFQHGTCVPKDALNYITWSVVRNPYNRIVSLWKMSQRPNQRTKRNTPKLDRFIDFLDWLKNGSLDFYRLSQYEWFHKEIGMKVEGSEATGIPDFVLKFEELPDCFQQLPFVNLPINLPYLNSQTIKEIKELSNEEMILAADYVELDCKEFGYEFMN